MTEPQTHGAKLAELSDARHLAALHVVWAVKADPANVAAEVAAFDAADRAVKDAIAAYKASKQ